MHGGQMGCGSVAAWSIKLIWLTASLKGADWKLSIAVLHYMAACELGSPQACVMRRATCIDFPTFVRRNFKQVYVGQS
jgi:hypothetical protein